jgi:hypothetical protein
MYLTRTQTLMKYTGLVYAVSFTGSVLVFIALPAQLFSLMNRLSAAVTPSLPPAADTGKFWLSLTVSMMATITVLSLYIYRDITRYYEMAVPIVIAKFTSTVFGLAFFFTGMLIPETKWNTLANLIIMVTDFPMGLFMLYLYRKVKKELV